MCNRWGVRENVTARLKAVQVVRRGLRERTNGRRDWDGARQERGVT